MANTLASLQQLMAGGNYGDTQYRNTYGTASNTTKPAAKKPTTVFGDTQYGATNTSPVKPTVQSYSGDEGWFGQNILDQSKLAAQTLGQNSVLKPYQDMLKGRETYEFNNPFHTGANYQDLIKQWGSMSGGNNSNGGYIGDYYIAPTSDGGYQIMRRGEGLGTSQTPADYVDAQGNYVGGKMVDSSKSGLAKAWETIVPMLTTSFIGAGIAGGLGYGPLADGGAGAAGAGGGTAGVTGTNGAFLGEGVTSGIGAWDKALANAIAGGGAAGAGGLASQLGSKAANSGLGSILKAALGGGGNSKGGGGLGSIGLNDIIGMIGGGVDANRQGNAAKEMLNWLNTNQAKMEGYMKPGSPEYNAAWEAMSRKDAAAGRNSQYGPRTSDFLANVAKEKADNTLRFTTGTSRAYADALNQDASKYAGLSAALGAMGQGGGGGGITLGDIMGLFGGGSGGGSITDMIPDGFWDWGDDWDIDWDWF
jgi:hypothetical protein